MKTYDEIVETDVLVIGSGAAGLMTVAGAASGGKRVVAVSKGRPGKACNTVLAGAGFRCSTDAYPVEVHRSDTLEGGKMVNDRRLVDALVQDASVAVAALVASGVPGEYQERGFFIRGDSFVGGPKLTPPLVRMCVHSGVRFLDGVVITSLLVHQGVCCGAVGFFRRTNATVAFRASSVVLAAGGGAGIFRFNDNAPGSCGEGYALALDGGLELVDMEFVQFYPLIRADCGSERVLLPAAFADPARITNRLGEDLKEKYGLFSRPIALMMRDRFSRALLEEIRNGNGVDGAILMDMRDVRAEEVRLSESLLRRFERILDFRRKPVKIRPAAHFTMGGVEIDSYGRTSVKGLYVVGETAGGTHGANRLGGNALSEAVVFGIRCGRAVLGDAPPFVAGSSFESAADRVFRKIFSPGGAGGGRPPAGLRVLGEILWKNAGIIRSGASLKEALSAVDGILDLFSEPGSWNPLVHPGSWQLRAAALTARSIIASAVARTESRGAHFREDFPRESIEWVRNIHVFSGDSGVPEVGRIVEVSA
ncbi:MAG TPA: FAD-binding protein [Desulfobacteraceae bacterium]|nr:FAD-binding protein [Desulfobacteraceae bacterium]